MSSARGGPPSSSGGGNLVELGNKYKGEAEQTINGLRQRVNVQKIQEDLNRQVAELQPTINAKKDEYINILKDVSDAAIPGGKLVETFLWAAVLQFAFGFTVILTSIILAPFLNLMFTTFPGLILSFFVLPYYAYQQLAAVTDEADGRYKMLYFALAEGVVFGHLIAYRYISTTAPVVFFTPVMIAVVAQYGAAALPARTAFLGASLGGGVGLHLVYGLITGNLGFPYLLLSLFYAAAGFVGIQLVIKDRHPQLVQLIFFLGVMISQAVIFGMFGGAKEDVQRE